MYFFLKSLLRGVHTFAQLICDFAVWQYVEHEFRHCAFVSSSGRSKPLKIFEKHKCLWVIEVMNEHVIGVIGVAIAPLLLLWLLRHIQMPAVAWLLGLPRTPDASFLSFPTLHPSPVYDRSRSWNNIPKTRK